MTAPLRNWGWKSDAEKSTALRMSAVQPHQIRRPASVPAEVWPRWLRVEDQGQTSSCVGHATSSAAEVLHWFATKGNEVQLSRWQAYISAQQESGLVGQDQGATIYGTVSAAGKRGVCREELAEFTGKYYTMIDDEAWADAKLRLIRSHVNIESAAQAKEFIGGGMGAIIVGVPCGQRMMNCGGILDRVDESGGGHALAVVGYKEINGKLHFGIPNSWGREYGEDGWLWVSATGFDTWCRMVRANRAEVQGVSDLTVPEPRDISFVGMIG